MENDLKHHLFLRRKQAKLSQSALAAKLQTLGLQVNQQRISEWEAGRAWVSWDELPYLAAALKCSPNDLVLWTEFVKRLK